LEVPVDSSFTVVSFVQGGRAGHERVEDDAAAVCEGRAAADGSPGPAPGDSI